MIFSNYNITNIHTCNSIHIDKQIEKEKKNDVRLSYTYNIVDDHFIIISITCSISVIGVFVTNR